DPRAPAFAVDVAALTASGRLDPSFGSKGQVSATVNSGPAGAGFLPDHRALVWTSGGEIVALDPDGTAASALDPRLPGIILAATIDASERLVIVGALTTDPLTQRWFVRRYLLL